MIQLDLFTDSPINVEHLNGQNRRLFDYLSAGNTIHVFDPAVKRLKIGYLNSRIADIRKVLLNHGRDVYKRMIKAVNTDGELVDVKQYSFFPFIQPK